MLLYVDESGNADSRHDVFVLGGLAVDEAAADWLRREIESVIVGTVGTDGAALEFHAKAVRAGSGPWFRIERSKREALMSGLCDLLASWGQSQPDDFALFGVAISHDDNRKFDPVERSFEELFLLFRRQLVRKTAGGRSEFGLVVADESRYEDVLQPITKEWREVGTRFGPLRRLVEVPLFADSQATRLLQMADLVAYVTHRAYVAQDKELFDTLLRGFRPVMGMPQGLLHLHERGAPCDCVACSAKVRLKELRRLERSGDPTATAELHNLEVARGLANPLSELELSPRCMRALSNDGIESVQELLAHTEVDLLGIRNFGVSFLNEVKEKLVSHGFVSVEEREYRPGRRSSRGEH